MLAVLKHLERKGIERAEKSGNKIGKEAILTSRPCTLHKLNGTKRAEAKDRPPATSTENTQEFGGAS
jgi:hypothetical protein